MTEYTRQTKANIEEKIAGDEFDDGMSDIDQAPANFIIDNFKAAHNTFNVILAQREIDMQRITALSVKIEQGKAMIDKLDVQKYHISLDNANLKIELDDFKQMVMKNDAIKLQEAKTLVEKVVEKTKRSKRTFFNIIVVFNMVVILIVAIMTYDGN